VTASGLPERTIALDATFDTEDPAAVAQQIPAADTLPAGTTVRVDAVAIERRTGVRRFLGDRRVRVSRAVRCSALVARGYTGVHAEGDDVRAVAAAAGAA
jgi:hypothetical protein